MNDAGDRRGVRLGLLRHGRTDWNRAHRLQGRVDRPLDAEGRAEIAAHRLPPDWDDVEIVASPLRRAYETASILGDGRAVRQDARLIEQDFGDWEGRRGEDLATEDHRYRPIEAWGWAHRPPGGESVAELRDRLTAFLADLAQNATGGAVLAVCHIGVMRVILALAHGWRFEGSPPFKVKRLRIYPLVIGPDGAPHVAGEPMRLVKREPTENRSCV